MDILIGYHRHLVEGLTLVILLNLLLPLVLRSSMLKRVTWTRIGYFAFWALWSMVAFSGLMVWIFAKQPMNLAIISMFTLLILLPILDIYRAIKLKKIWLLGDDGLGFNSLVVFIELLLTIGVTLLAIFGR